LLDFGNCIDVIDTCCDQDVGIVFNGSAVGGNCLDTIGRGTCPLQCLEPID
jgi:hypothetical protein